MSEVHKHAPGNFCWVEIGTTDASKAKAFYSNLFGWETEDVPAGPGMYTLLKKQGKQVGGLWEYGPEQRAQNMPPHWLSYVAVESADEAVKRTATLGGRVVMDAMDVMDVGRMAVLSDPAGATFAVWQPKQHKGADILGETGAVCWTELATRDTRAAARFYRGLFDWTDQVQDMGPMQYTTYINAGEPAAGMYEMTSDYAGVPPYWMPYFAVDDCEAAVDKAQALGGEMRVPPTDVPNVGRMAVLADPTGAMFSIIRLTQPA
jgi:predicted enzyme related to lactoylglutathione lyase